LGIGNLYYVAFPTGRLGIPKTIEKARLGFTIGEFLFNFGKELCRATRISKQEV